MLGIIVIIVFVIIITVTVHSNIAHDRELKERLKTSFGKMPEPREIDYESIECYTKYTDKNARDVDKITWNDLDMNKIYERLNTCQSSVGDEYFYDVLKRPQSSLDKLLKREELIEFFDKNTDTRLNVQFALAKIGKKDYNGVAGLIFRSDFDLLKYNIIYNIFALLPLVSLAVLFFHINAGVIALILTFLINMFIHIKSQKHIDMNLTAINYFSRIIRCCEKFVKIEDFKELPCIVRLSVLNNYFKKAANKAPSAQSGMGASLVDVFWMYISITFLIEVRGYNNFMKCVKKKQDYVHEVYVTIGEIEASLSILSSRKSFPSFCIPKFCAENIIKCQDIYHPLIDNAITNSHTFDNDMLLTGSNASGKSTFIKTLAINGILAQTINTCTASSFTARFFVIITSMAIRDNIYEGESYFTAELKSIKRILDITKKHYTVCFIDEILRGTNTEERIIASQVILRHLHTRDSLCLAATHDIELTQILENEYNNFHFCEQVTDKDISFDYKLKPGPSKTKNAIKLLDVMGFDREIIDEAQALGRNHER